MEKQIVKFLSINVFFNFIFCQMSIETKEYSIYKDKNTHNIDISQFIDMDGNYLIQLVNVTDLQFNRMKKIIIQTCELDFFISSMIDSKNINVKQCSNNLEISNTIIIDDKNSYISFNHEKFNLLTGLFTFWITGKYENKNFNSNIETDGLMREWFDNGDIYIEYNFDNGKRHGTQKRWFQNGNLDIIYYFTHGKLDGEQKSWYMNGNQKSILYYQNDIMHGLTKQWYDNGQVKTIKSYIHGDLERVIESYDKNGNSTLNDF